MTREEKKVTFTRVSARHWARSTSTKRGYEQPGCGILCLADRASRYNSGKWPTWCTILFPYMLISILYMFRATSRSSSGELVVSIQRLVYAVQYKWPSSMQVWKDLPDLHTRRPLTQSDLYQMLYWYNWSSWWWARSCSKHVQDWNKHIRKKNCASSWSFTRTTGSGST
jgi:hypothetical protein